MRKLLSAILLTILSCLLFSCATYENTKQSFSKVCSRDIAAIGIKDTYELEQFFMAHNPKADKAKVRRLAGYYVTEGRFEGINSDVAFCQMCLETGFLRYGGLVKPWFNNYCGLGAMNKKNPGEKFPRTRSLETSWWIPATSMCSPAGRPLLYGNLQEPGLWTRIMEINLMLF